MPTCGIRSSSAKLSNTEPHGAYLCVMWRYIFIINFQNKTKMELIDLKKQITEILIDFDSFREADVNCFVNDIIEKCDTYYGEKINNLQLIQSVTS